MRSGWDTSWRGDTLGSDTRSGDVMGTLFRLCLRHIPWLFWSHVLSVRSGPRRQASDGLLLLVVTSLSTDFSLVLDSLE